jgi:hypothetical protein
LSWTQFQEHKLKFAFYASLFPTQGRCSAFYICGRQKNFKRILFDLWPWRRFIINFECKLRKINMCCAFICLCSTSLVLYVKHSVHRTWWVLKKPSLWWRDLFDGYSQFNTWYRSSTWWLLFYIFQCVPHDSCSNHEFQFPKPKRPSHQLETLLRSLSASHFIWAKPPFLRPIRREEDIFVSTPLIGRQFGVFPIE